MKYDCKFLLRSVLKYDCKFLLRPVLKYDCKFQVAALMSLSQCAEVVEEQSHIDEIVTLLLKHMTDPHPRVRYAALHALGQVKLHSKRMKTMKLHSKRVKAMKLHSKRVKIVKLHSK